MSCWTSVTCIVRTPVLFDAETVFGKELVLRWDYPDNDYKKEHGLKEYEEKFEEIHNYNKNLWEDQENNPDAYLPVGSEGSLTYKCLAKKIPDGRFEYVIGGNLRDEFDDYKFVRWFQGCFLEWINKSKADENYEVYGRVTASNGVGSLSWEYGPEEL